MARPIKYYVIYEYGTATGIAHGLTEARRLHAGWNGHKTLLAAQEALSWWNYQHAPRVSTSSPKE